jgi:hypothetical protein
LPACGSARPAASYPIASTDGSGHRVRGRDPSRLHGHQEQPRKAQQHPSIRNSNRPSAPSTPSSSTVNAAIFNCQRRHPQPSTSSSSGLTRGSKVTDAGARQAFDPVLVDPRVKPEDDAQGRGDARGWGARHHFFVGKSAVAARQSRDASRLHGHQEQPRKAQQHPSIRKSTRPSAPSTPSFSPVNAAIFNCQRRHPQPSTSSSSGLTRGSKVTDAGARQAFDPVLVDPRVKPEDDAQGRGDARGWVPVTILLSATVRLRRASQRSGSRLHGHQEQPRKPQQHPSIRHRRIGLGHAGGVISEEGLMVCRARRVQIGAAAPYP